MEEPKERKTTTAKSPNAVPGPSLFSSLHPNPVYSSHLPSTPASRPTRATYAPPSASSTTPSPYPPTRLRRSSAPSARAPAFTSPLSCRPPRPPRPAGRACRLPRHPSLQHGACCAPVSSSRLCTKLWIHTCPTICMILILLMIMSLRAFLCCCSSRQLRHHTTSPLCYERGHSSQHRAVSISTLPPSSFPKPQNPHHLPPPALWKGGVTSRESFYSYSEARIAAEVVELCNQLFKTITLGLNHEMS